ncbi:MAG: hypothetical protein M1480_19125 [Bacteroidetes bacterium]|nr:hypothetical protein [Bacteroidota bacterium]
MNGVKLLTFLNKINTGKINRSEMREFIEICCKIGVICLNKKYHKHKTFFSINGISFIDVAVDSISPLFVVNETFNSTEINKSLATWGKKISSEREASFFVYSVVWKRVDQTVNQILAELDPLFGKILTNIIYHVKQNGCKRIYYFGQAYLVETGNAKITGTLIDEHEFNDIPVELIKNTYDKIIKDLIDYIKKRTNHFPAIPLMNLATRIKNLYANQTVLLDFIEENHEFSIYINQILKESLERMDSFIDINYVAKGKLSDSEGEIFKIALKEIAIDLTDGGISHSIKDYIIPHFADFNNHEVKDKYHNILDYLYRLLKKDFKNAIEHPEFSQKR